MAQVEGLLPLTPHPVPPSCWKVDKKGWDVFVISIVGCLWLSFGCLLVVFATYGLWVVFVFVDCGLCIDGVVAARLRSSSPPCLGAGIGPT